MEIEYKIASIAYTGTDKEGYHEEKSTLNHIFIPTNNPDYNDEEKEYIQDHDEPEIMAESLCYKFKDGLYVSEEDGYGSHAVNYHELEKDFTKCKKERLCKLCTKKLKKLERKKR